MVLAIGLIWTVPSAMADGDGHEFGVSITAAETMIDVSSDPGWQIASGRNRTAERALVEARAGTLITLLITTNEIVNLGAPDTGVENADLKQRDGYLDIADIVVDAYDAEGRSLGILDWTAEVLDATNPVLTLSHRDPNNPGREFLVRVDESELTNAYTAQRAGGAPFEIHTLLFSIPPGKMQQADIAHVTAVRNNDHKHFHSNGRVKVFQVDLVDNDEGMAMYNLGVGTDAAMAGVPGVVAIQSLRERRGFIETVPFQVRVILTEEPAGGLTPALINVMNGSATAVTKGATLKGAHAAVTDGRSAQQGELGMGIVSYTPMTPGTLTEPPADGSNTGSYPAATGRDNKYHQYFVTIEPAPGLSGADVVISVNQFSDKVKPTPRMYVPLSYQEIVATTLTPAQQIIRNARVMNETLTVVATTTASTDHFKPSADARLPHEKFINEKLVIPANGYLVLASGDYGQSGIRKADAKLADKKDVGEDLYNSVEKFDPPYPGSDLASYLRNGATIQLVYQDIPGNTAAADADTGYAGATSAAIKAGDVIINEIMWGHDRGLDNRAIAEGQWIELHNTTSAAISIDKQEWLLVYGTTTSFTGAGSVVVDTFSNNPSSGYWGAPGQSGTSSSLVKIGVAVEKEGQKETTQVLETEDVISMSRVTGATDGTAAASWARSILPAANFAGTNRIGTPGAKNSYDTSAQDMAKAAMEAKAAAEAAAMETTSAPVATAGDLMITEIMFASNEGRLPQWIEITNGAVGAVSLNGWVLGIDNDPADAKVAAPSLGIKLDGVTLGEGQSALVVSKTGRNSGVGTGTGDLRADRIIDASSQVKPATMTDTLLSEMAFRIALEPPLPLAGGATDRGKVVGNLGGGWKLPMSEGDRSSIIRREGETGTEIMGTDAAGWVLASETGLADAYLATYYGDKDDEGTPGYDAGGALPVELSKFGAKRDRVTGQVVITWETQSELNNAGFFIKRSQQKNGQFAVVNPTMIAGAGTTSEKQSYTYTDTTAQPNIVYYYQIEDVSLDGNRQTLTRSHRLKGHIGAAGKLTTSWGELKEQQ